MKQDQPTEIRPSTIDHSAFKGSLKTENAALRERLKDLDAQIQRLQSSRLIAPHEEEANRELREQFEAMRAEQNTVALFLREHYAAEIAAGFHGDRPFSEIINGYLAELKALKTQRTKPGWFESFFGGGVS